MDGTLFDTVPANQAAYAVALAPYGVSLSVEDFALHCNGRYYRDFLGELLGGDEAKIDAVHDAKLAAYPALFHRIRENTALFSLLQTLRADYHTALVTSATRCSVEAILLFSPRELLRPAADECRGPAQKARAGRLPYGYGALRRRPRRHDHLRGLP